MTQFSKEEKDYKIEDHKTKYEEFGKPKFDWLKYGPTEKRYVKKEDNPND